MFSRTIQTILLSIIFSSTAHAGFVIVANSDSGLNEMSVAELKKVYLKKIPTLPNGKSATVVGLTKGNARDEFLKTVLRKSESNLNSYWSRLMFSGRADSPRLFKTNSEVLDYIRSTPGAIGFVDSNVNLGDNITSITLN